MALFLTHRVLSSKEHTWVALALELCGQESAPSPVTKKLGCPEATNLLRFSVAYL